MRRESVTLERLTLRRSMLGLEYRCGCETRSYTYKAVVRDHQVGGIIEEARAWIGRCPDCGKGKD